MSIGKDGTFKLFQFLIGRLRTGTSPTLDVTVKAFQFLIGRLRTEVSIGKDGTFKLFQFLIGRLRTGSDGRKIFGLDSFNSL